VLALQDDFTATRFEAARIDALFGAGLEAFEAYRHRDTQQIGAQGLKLLVMQSLKIVATHTFGSREYRLDAELVLIIGPLFPRGGLVHENPVSASSQVGFHSHHLRLR
jgi:hypothetical protein